MAVNDRRMCDDLDERMRSLDSRGAPVRLERLLQEGAFSRVYQGTYIHHGHRGGSQEVLVKTVTGKSYVVKLIIIYLTDCNTCACFNPLMLDRMLHFDQTRKCNLSRINCIRDKGKNGKKFL